MLPIDKVLSLLADNTLRRGCPLPVPSDTAYSWARGLDLPRQGEYTLYTGCLYQLAPYIKKLSTMLSSLEGSRLAGAALGAARLAGRLTSLSRLIGKPDQREVERSRRVLRSIVELLRESGVNPAYLYEDDLYSGVLLYDLGLDEEFAEHASRVYKALRRRASKLITVDPHTHVVLRDVYPRFIDSFDLEVYSYLELIDEDRLHARAGNKEYVIHDSCLYARILGLHDRARKLLERVGVRYLEPRHTGRDTLCCGGPIESIAPRLSHSIAEARVKELLERSSRVAIMCPLCYVSLSRAAGEKASFKDLAELLAEGLSSDQR